ncbi:MAG: response regulator transcription factor [Bdellovibrionota bacterium]
MKRVLLVEDDPKLSSLIARSLEGDEFKLTCATTIEALDNALAHENYEIVILDRLIGSVDTKTKLNSLHQTWPHTPVLVISTINTPIERAELINQGADDYLGKPFLTEELIARMRSLARRSVELNNDKRMIGKALFDIKNRRLSREGKFESLPSREFMILNVLSASPGKVLSRPELLESVWGNINHSETNLVEATVANLRKRIAGLDCGFQIKNQRNIGYWIEG